MSENPLWDLLNAVTDEMNRRAIPGPWLSIAYATGSKFITDRRTATPAPALPVAQQMPVIYVDTNGQLVSRVSAEQVETVLGPVVDKIRSTVLREQESSQYAGEGPISALYGVKYSAQSLAEAKTIASDGMAALHRRAATPTRPSQVSKAQVLPAEPLWDRKGNVIHAAVDRLGAAQRAAAAVGTGDPGDQDETHREAPRA
ncbi:hypothetical protein LJR290_007679 [Variovorax sp. LjRoot290]|uniref:hypothetical protein n=1 Tax=Variovorax sp. LjRoot290 TaxID=3342316 RepID=UPI003ECEDEFB